MNRKQKYEGEKKYGWGIYKIQIRAEKRAPWLWEVVEEMFETAWGRKPRQRDHDNGNRRRCCGVVSLEFNQVAKQSLLGLEDVCAPAVR